MLADAGKVGNSTEADADAIVVNCDHCGNRLEECMCACPYCGEVDGCECCLFDAATGG